MAQAQLRAASSRSTSRWKNAASMRNSRGRDRPRRARTATISSRRNAAEVAPAIEDGPRDPQLAAHRADVALHLRALDDAQAHPVYALVEGHRSVLPQWFPWSGCHSGNDRADGLLLRSREVSTLLRVRTL